MHPDLQPAKLIALALVLVSLLAARPAAAEGFVRLGTAGENGVYFALGSEICRAVNARSDGPGVRCAPVVTAGSVANLRTVRDGQLPLALAQWNDLRALAAPQVQALVALHDEAFVVVTGPAVRGDGIAALRGARVNLGQAGSGHAAAMAAALAAAGLGEGNMAAVTRQATAPALAALCAGEIDAVPLMIGHPVAAVAETVQRCGARLLVPTPVEIAAMTAGGALLPVTLPSGTYPGQAPDLPSAGTPVVLVASADLPEAVAAAVVDSLHRGLERIAGGHPALRTLTPDALTRPLPGVPRHAGAAVLFRSAKPQGGSE